MMRDYREFTQDLANTFATAERDAAAQEAASAQARAEAGAAGFTVFLIELKDWSGNATDEALRAAWGVLNKEIERRLRFDRPLIEHMERQA